MVGLWMGLLSVYPSGSTPAQTAPSAEDFSLVDVKGKTVRLSDYAGKVVVMSFWATWCGPCKEEMPHLQALYDARKDEGLVVLAIAADDARSAFRIKPTVRKHGYTFPVLLDRDATVINAYHPAGTLPYRVVVDRQGRIVDRHEGYQAGDEKALAAMVSELLGPLETPEAAKPDSEDPDP